jgi:hypothetical protein
MANLACQSNLAPSVPSQLNIEIRLMSPEAGDADEVAVESIYVLCKLAELTVEEPHSTPAGPGTRRYLQCRNEPSFGTAARDAEGNVVGA